MSVIILVEASVQKIQRGESRIDEKYKASERAKGTYIEKHFNNRNKKVCHSVFHERNIGSMHNTYSIPSPNNALYEPVCTAQHLC